jgi:hypothetical protein
MTGDRPAEFAPTQAESLVRELPIANSTPAAVTPASTPETPFLRLLKRLETIEQERIAQDTIVDPDSGAAIEPLEWAYRELEGLGQIPSVKLSVRRQGDSLFLQRGLRRVARLEYSALIEGHPWRVRFYPSGGWLGWDSFSESYETGDRALEELLAGSLQILRDAQPWWQRGFATPENRSLLLLLLVMAIALVWVLRV